MPMQGILPQLGATVTRLGQGVRVRYAAKVPKKLLKLYDMENCPYCRLVREVLTELDMDVLVQPCPKGGERYRSVVIQQGGKAQFPWLWDENTGAQLYESVEIIAYLYETYVGTSVPMRWRLRGPQLLSSFASSAWRVGAGTRLKLSACEPQQPLILYSFEASPYARSVREVLCEMELPYVVRNVGRVGWRDWVLPGVREKFSISADSAQRNRSYLLGQYGQVTVPFLEDPNNGKALGQSKEIIGYLKTTYMPK